MIPRRSIETLSLLQPFPHEGLKAWGMGQNFKRHPNSDNHSTVAERQVACLGALCDGTCREPHHFQVEKGLPVHMLSICVHCMCIAYCRTLRAFSVHSGTKLSAHGQARGVLPKKTSGMLKRPVVIHEKQHQVLRKIESF